MNFFKKKSGIVFVLLVAIILYYQVYHFEYLWDDDLLLVDNIALLNEKLNWNMLSQPVLPGSSYFRPLVFLSWFIEFKLFGQSSSVSHIVNFIIFLCNIIMTYSLVYFISKLKDIKYPLIVSTLSALLYAVHPAHVEAVAWVSGRFDLMSSFFMLLACNLFLANYIKQKEINIFTGLIIGVLYICALLSKESGIILPAILLILYFLCSNQNEKIIFKLLDFIKLNKILIVSMIIMAVFYFVLRIDAMHHVYHYNLSEGYYKKAILDQKLPLYAIKAYFLQALLPFYTLGPIHLVVDYIKASFINNISLIFISIFLIFILYFSFFKNIKSAWLLILYLCSISLVIFLIPLSSSDSIIQERFMVFGLSFFCPAIVFLLYDIYIFLSDQKIKVVIPIVLCFWVVAATAVTASILPMWKNELTLWNWMYKIYPEYEVVRGLYYYSLLKEGNSNALIKEMNAYHQKYGAFNTSDQILYAKALLMKNDPESLNYLEGAISVIPKFHEAYPNNTRDAVIAFPQFKLTAVQIASAYDSLSIATLWYKNDPKSALHYNFIAEKYFKPTEKIPLLYDRLALLYVLKQDVEANALAQQLRNIQLINKNANIENVVTIINIWCVNNKITDNRCTQKQLNKVIF